MISCYFCDEPMVKVDAIKISEKPAYICPSCFKIFHDYLRETMSLEELGLLMAKHEKEAKNDE